MEIEKMVGEQEAVRLIQSISFLSGTLDRPGVVQYFIDQGFSEDNINEVSKFCRDFYEMCLLQDGRIDKNNGNTYNHLQKPEYHRIEIPEGLSMEELDSALKEELDNARKRFYQELSDERRKVETW